MELLHLEIVTPNGIVFNGDVKSVTLPGVDGEFGVYPKHSSLLTNLKTGLIEIEEKDGPSDLTAIKWGSAKIDETKVVVLVQEAVYVGGSKDDSTLKETMTKAIDLIKSISDEDTLLSASLKKIEKMRG